MGVVFVTISIVGAVVSVDLHPDSRIGHVLAGVIGLPIFHVAFGRGFTASIAGGASGARQLGADETAGAVRQPGKWLVVAAVAVSAALLVAISMASSGPMLAAMGVAVGVASVRAARHLRKLEGGTGMTLLSRSSARTEAKRRSNEYGWYDGA